MSSLVQSAYEHDAIGVLVGACKHILGDSNGSGGIVSLIRQCNKQSTQSLEVCDKYASSGLFPALVEVCRLAASPLDGSDIFMLADISLPTLIQAITQLLANYTARGAPYTVALWECLKVDNFIGYQHVVSACKRVHNRNASVAAVASIYNCLVSFYKLANETPAYAGLAFEFIKCRPLCCQIFLSIDTSNDKSLVSTDHQADEGSANDPLAEWMHLLIQLLLRYGDVFELFRTLAPSVNPVIDTSTCWNEVITHEQVILLNMVLDVFDECIASDRVFMEQVAPTLVNDAEKEESLGLHPVALVESRFFQQHCLFLRHLAMEIIPRCHQRMHCCQHIYHGMSQPGRAAGTAAHATLHDEEWLVVARLCVDAVAAGVLIMPDEPALWGVRDLLKRTVHTSADASISFRLSGDIDPTLCSDQAFAACRDMMVLLSPPPGAKAPRVGESTAVSYDAVNEKLVSSISGKINLEESLSAGAGAAASSDSRAGAGPSKVVSRVSDSGAVILSNQLLKSISKCLGNLVHGCTVAQDLLRTSNCMIVVLNHCSTNVNNPLLREYGLMCVRNATENNEDNQEFIRQIKVK